MLRVKDITNRSYYTYYFAGVEFVYNDMFDNYIIVKIDEKMKKIWI